jgi:hypothetical protein
MQGTSKVECVRGTCEIGEILNSVPVSSFLISFRLNSLCEPELCCAVVCADGYRFAVNRDGIASCLSNTPKNKSKSSMGKLT